MSQKKVDAYKQNKKNRGTESRKEVRRRRLEICIVLAIIIVGVIWFIAAGVKNSTAKATTIPIETEAIDNFTNNLQNEIIEDEAVTEEAEETENAGE